MFRLELGQTDDMMIYDYLLILLGYCLDIHDVGYFLCCLLNNSNATFDLLLNNSNRHRKFRYTMQRNATQCNLQNSSSISMRPNTARHIRRRTRHKKGPLPQLATPPTQLLQIPHLPQRHTPQRQNLLVNISIFLLRRPALKRR